MPKRVVRHEVEQPQDQTIRLIPLTQGQNAIVDTSDYDRLSQWNWYAHKKRDGNFYARRIENGKTIYMHRAVLRIEFQELPLVDHIRPSSTLDNRNSNLRLATNAENSMNQGISVRNSSGFKGVSWSKAMGKWQVHIYANGAHEYLGCFPTAEEGHRAYVLASVRLHGEFSRIY